MKRILHITMFYSPLGGGQQNYIHSLNTIFIKRGYYVEVLQAYKPEKSNISVKYLIKDNLLNKLFFLLFRNLKQKEWFLFNYYLGKNKEYISTFDTIICHYPFHFPVVRWHKGVIVLSHGVDWPERPTYFCDKYKKYAIGLIRQFKPKIVANDTDFLRKINLAISPGTSYFSEVREGVWFIPNCVNTRKYKDDKKQRKNVILMPRNVRKARGIHLGIESFYEAVKIIKGYKLIIAGGFEKGDYYYNYCTEKIRNFKLTGKVYFVGSKNEEELIKLYKTSKLTLIPTIKFEGTSLSAIESMCTGTPVVSTKVGGLLDLPTAKAEMNPVDIATCIIQTINNDKLGTAQMKQSRSVFNLINWEKAWLKVIEK